MSRLVSQATVRESGSCSCDSFVCSTHIYTNSDIIRLPMDLNRGVSSPRTSSIISLFFNHLSSSFTYVKWKGYVVLSKLSMLRTCLNEFLHYGFLSSHFYFKKHIFQNNRKIPVSESLFFTFNKVVTLFTKELRRRCFLVDFRKFLKTPFLQNTSTRLLLKQTELLHERHFQQCKKSLP